VKDTNNGRVVFLKRAKLDGSLNGDAIRREVNIYEKLSRSNATGVLEVYDVEYRDNSIAIITEYADGGTLGQWVTSAVGGTLDGTATKDIATKILAAIRELHNIGIIHRDLKPGNILRQDKDWKLADFGIAKNLGRLMTNRTFQMTGSPGYAPPEQVAGAEARPSADVYPFGKLVTFMLTGGTDPDVLTTPEWAAVVRACVAPDPDDRPTLDELEALLAAVPA
jgi:serine/threonine protein kinase